MFIQLNSLTALAVAPRVESVLNLQGIAAPPTISSSR
jgi:hypothetical protein